MEGSFRRRLFAIAALSVLACAAAIVSVLFLSRATLEDRIARAHDNVAREVSSLLAEMRATPIANRSTRERKSGELESGYAQARDGARPFVGAALDESTHGDVVVIEREDEDGAPVLVAAAPIDDGGFVFAVQRVVAGRQTRGLRYVVVLLSLLSLGLVIASLRTLSAVERGVSSLRASLAALAKDLGATVERPGLSELGEVASGIESLAKELNRAQKEHDRLTRELAARERLAALGRVAAGVAHEVRNPLASMKLRADLARTGGEATPAVARDLEDIASEISRLDRLVSDLLVVSGRRTGPRKEVDVGELVAARVALLSPWAAEKKVTLTSKGKGVIAIDSDAIARAVDNLLRNAVEASPEKGAVNASVQTRDGAVEITVSDAGTGVPQDRAAELFEPFFTTKPDGTGLGLALAHAVASAHGGSLAYERKDETTRFTLTLIR